MPGMRNPHRIRREVGRQAGVPLRALRRSDPRRAGSVSQDPETVQDVLCDIRKELSRIADALETYNNAAIRSNGRDGQVEIYVTNHQA
jgi:hypothetical protein